MATPSKKTFIAHGQTQSEYPGSAELISSRRGVPAWWDVSTESWTKDELEVLAEELILAKGSVRSRPPVPYLLGHHPVPDPQGRDVVLAMAHHRTPAGAGDGVC
jgi:hypothetical protein